MTTRSPFLFLALSIAASACGETACDQAEDHASECQVAGLNGPEVSTSGMTGSPDVVCQGTALCVDKCFNNASCQALKGQDPAGYKAYSNCVSQCQ